MFDVINIIERWDIVDKDVDTVCHDACCLLQSSNNSTSVTADDDNDDDDNHDNNNDNDDDDDAVSNMYMFEGRDYSKEPSAADCRVFHQLVDGTHSVTYLLCFLFYWPAIVYYAKAAHKITKA